MLEGEEEERLEMRDAQHKIFFAKNNVIITSNLLRSGHDGDDAGSSQPLQLFHHDGMDHDGLHPVDCPPFICGFISYSAVTRCPKA